MRILLNGDSNVAGAELKDKSLSLGVQFAKLVGSNDILNISFSGASNDAIYDSTMEILKDQTFDFVLIGWTEMSRVQWFMDDVGKGYLWEIYNFDKGKLIPEKYAARLKHWQENMQKSGPYHESLSRYWHEKIFNLHCFMEHRKVPHLFFNAFHPFRIHEQEFQLDWNEKFFYPYSWKDTYVEWCRSQGYNEITQGFCHFEETGQLAWAERLYSFVKEKSIV